MFLMLVYLFLKQFKMIKHNFKYIVLFYLLICCGSCFSKSPIQQNRYDLIFVDSVTISTATVIRFVENDRVAHILIERGILDTLSLKEDVNYNTFICKTGYMFYVSSIFSGIINNYLYSISYEDSVYSFLADKIRYAGKIDIWKSRGNDGKVKVIRYHGWECLDIKPTKFLFFLVKGSLLRRSLPFREWIVLDNMDNVYFKVLVPITW